MSELLAAPRRSAGTTLLGRGHGVIAVECVCCDGRHSPRRGGQYPGARVVVVLEGGFHARTSRGAGLVGQGALLFGNAGEAYEYGHVDDGGDRTMGFDVEAVLLDDVARSLGLRGPPRFERAGVAASPATTAAVALAHEALASREPDAVEQAALAILELAFTLPGRGAMPAAAASPSPPHAERKVAQVMRRVEAHPADDCSLDALAALAGMSRFHLVRSFRASTGQTPRQFVIAARLRAAAAALRTTRSPIAEVAMSAGFGDLSHFHATFARWFGMSPGAYRRR